MENIVQLTLEELEVKGKFYELIGYLNSYTDTRVINEKEKEIVKDEHKPPRSLEEIKSHDAYSILTNMTVNNPDLMGKLIGFYCDILCKDGENKICADYPLVVQAIYDLKDYLPN